MHYIKYKKTCQLRYPDDVKIVLYGIFFLKYLRENQCTMRKWSSLTFVKVSKSRIFSIFNCVVPMPSAFFLLSLEARCVMLFQWMTSGKQLGLKFGFFFLPSLPPSLFSDETTGPVLFQQIPKSPKAVTPPLGGVWVAYQSERRKLTFVRCGCG